MSNDKRYYWLKLKEGFFRDKKMKKLRKIAGGDTYTIIYLKMQLLSLSNEGALYHEGVEETFEEEVALEIDEEHENVRIAMAFLAANGLIEKIDENKYILPQAIECIGSESSSAARVRKHREKNKNSLPVPNNGKALQCNTQVTNCNTEIEIEKRERDRDINKEYMPGAETASEPEEAAFIYLTLNDKSEYPVLYSKVEEYQELYPAVDVQQQLRNMKGWLDSNPTKRKTKRGIERFINSWLAREQDKGGSKVITVANTGVQGNKGNNRALERLKEMGEI